MFNQLESLMGNRLHIVPNQGEWQLKGENALKAIKTFTTKEEAVQYGKGTATNQKAELVIHKRNGQIQNSNSYGNDPYPPKDMKP